MKIELSSEQIDIVIEALKARRFGAWPIIFTITDQIESLVIKDRNAISDGLKLTLDKFHEYIGIPGQ